MAILICLPPTPARPTSTVRCPAAAAAAVRALEPPSARHQHASPYGHPSGGHGYVPYASPPPSLMSGAAGMILRCYRRSNWWRNRPGHRGIPPGPSSPIAYGGGILQRPFAHPLTSRPEQFPHSRGPLASSTMGSRSLGARPRQQNRCHPRGGLYSRRRTRTAASRCLSWMDGTHRDSKVDPFFFSPDEWSLHARIM
ncbi:hypothetical protein B0H16DRAFT_1578325 [Mycena metata]|uniref:Uncharacterized protein n=1 Tax=Mycena metata TaxID=1033252 RepID=A0AAD7I3D5_9AGAR|nr:hypothetical protein B0H16DRAFT_1578325 [Mycena metata]